MCVCYVVLTGIFSSDWSVLHIFLLSSKNVILLYIRLQLLHLMCLPLHCSHSPPTFCSVTYAVEQLLRENWKWWPSLCFLQFKSWTIQIPIGGKVITTEVKAFSQPILLQQTCRLNRNSSVSLLMFVWSFYLTAVGHRFSSAHLAFQNSPFIFLQRTLCGVYELNSKFYISVKHNFVVLFRIMTTCSGLRDQHQTIVTKFLTIKYISVQMKLVIRDPV